MSELNSAGNELATDDDQGAPEYRPVNLLAVLGLIAGAASVLAFAHPLLWCLPVLGAALSGLALRQMAVAELQQVGRRAALVGLTLSLVLGAAAVTRLAVFRWQMRVETMQLAKQWFEALRNRDPYLADQLTLPPGARLKPEDDRDARYAEPNERHRLEEDVEDPAERMMLSLGKYAQVRYFTNELTDVLSEHPAVIDIYAISVRHEGKTTSCFVQLIWSRQLEFGSHRWYWDLKKATVLGGPPEGRNPAS